MEAPNPKPNESTSDQSKSGELLYHYTTQEGLLGIVGARELWATDVRFLNDTREFEDGLNVAIGMARQSSLGAEDGPRIVSYLENVLRWSFSKRPIYSVSFTGPLKKGEELFSSIDDPGDRLNMWRSYSERGIAYSIGLQREGLMTDIEGVDIQECSYLQETKEEYLTPIFNIFVDLLNECKRKMAEGLQNGMTPGDTMCRVRAELDAGFDQILPDLKAQVSACKHESFWEEREWRLTMAPSLDHPKVFHNSGRFGITPRVRIGLRSPDLLLPIKRIVIGPCPHMADAIESLKGLLARSGYRHMEISPSQIPYRNW